MEKTFIELDNGNWLNLAHVSFIEKSKDGFIAHEAGTNTHSTFKIEGEAAEAILKLLRP